MQQSHLLDNSWWHHFAICRIPPLAMWMWCSDIGNVFSKTERVDLGLMVVTAPAGMHKSTSYPLDMSNRFVSLSLLLDKLRLIALINILHVILIRLSLTSELLLHGSYCIINKTASSDRACCQATILFWGKNTKQTLWSPTYCIIIMHISSEFLFYECEHWRSTKKRNDKLLSDK